MDKSAFSLDNFDALARHFKVVKECPMCGAEYAVESRQVVVQEEAINVVHMKCTECQHALLLFIGATSGGVGIMGSMTDLSAEDLGRIQKHRAWTDDDLLSAANILHTKSELFINFLK